MAGAKDLIIKPITSQLAKQVVQRYHYSGKTTNNSQLHFGVYLNGKIHGAMQFGPCLDKHKIQGLVTGTLWHEFIELNRMAFDDELPRNSESRAISVVINLIRKHAPQIKWIISFADATQCGDGTIYRASGFILTGIRASKVDLWELPENLRHLSIGSAVVHRMTIHNKRSMISHWCVSKYLTHNVSLDKLQKDNGGVLINGFQLRYIYFIDKAYRQRLTVPEIPFSRIKEMGASMYKGEKT